MTPARPEVSRRRSLPLIWAVPVVAFIVAAWLVAREIRSRGPEITIAFEDGSGLEEGKTPLEYQGVAVGEVKKVALNPQLKGVEVTVRLDRSAAQLAVEGSVFWIVQPKIGFSGVSGLDTLLTGARIGVRPGSGEPRTRFTGTRQAPPEQSQSGRSFVLRMDRLGSLEPGAPVHYREVRVGRVEAAKLAPDATAVLVRVRIQAPYDRLVKAGTRFWNSGGMNMRLGLLGARLQTTSLESLVTGGVSFATPEGDAATDPAAEDTEFVLQREPEKSWLEWRPSIPLDPPPTW